MKYLPKFFSPREFVCPCCRQGHPATALVYALDVLRRAWSDVIYINSGFRCKKHNIEVGGATTSRHMIGCAADIRPRDPALLSAFKTLVLNMYGQRAGWEIKLYSSFVHLAVPREEASQTWAGGLMYVNIK